MGDYLADIFLIRMDLRKGIDSKGGGQQESLLIRRDAVRPLHQEVVKTGQDFRWLKFRFFDVSVLFPLRNFANDGRLTL